MIVRWSRSTALLAVLSLAAGGARATDFGPQLTAANPTTEKAAADKAAEAQRLAALAAQLAQQAAQLAAESNATAPAATASQSGWTARSSSNGSAAPTTTAASTTPVLTGTTAAPAAAAANQAAAANSRTHRRPEDIAIRFKGQTEANIAPSTVTARPISASEATAINATAPIVKTLPPTSIQSTAASTTISQDLSNAASGKHSEEALLGDSSVQLVARMMQDDSSLIPEAEPVPPPPYSDGNGNANGRKSKKINGNANGEEELPMIGSGEYCGYDACCPPPRMLFWTAGVEATFLNPDLNNSVAQFGVAEFAEERFDYFDTETTDVDSFYLAPRVWIGVQGCKWGMNLRYFHLNANEGAYDPVLGGNGEWDGPGCGVPDFGYTSCNDLEAYAIDLEVTRRVCLHDCAMMFSMGVRHASLEQNEQISGAALTDDSTVFGFASAHRQSRGTGLVFGWYGRRPIFPCSCVHWFYNARFSSVWGPTQTASETGAIIAVSDPSADVSGAAGSVNNASTYVDDTMFIGEIQLGLEWLYGLRCIPANAFFRVAAEYQRWDGGRGYTAAGSFVGAEIGGDATTLGETFASATEPQLDLVGLTIGTGLTW